MTLITSEYLSFFNDLAKNNHTQWFNESRKRYEQWVKKPFIQLVETLIEEIRKRDDQVQIKASEAIMRINKDIRFSKDKTPYHLYMSANISKFGKKDKSYPGFYFQIGSESLMVYGGIYMVETPVLNKVRAYLINHLKEFQNAYLSKDFVSKYGKIQGESNKRLPPEIQNWVENEPLLANKQFYYSAELDGKIITSEQLVTELMKLYDAAEPVKRVLEKALE